MTTTADRTLGAAYPATADLVAALRAAVDGEVSDSVRRRAEYSTDASNYRVVPQVVVTPRDVADTLAALDVARTAGAPVTLRGGGTSTAGNSVGPGVVLDVSRHLTAIGEIDPEARTAVVEPGVVMADLQRAAAPHGLRFGPDPSTQNRATLGGMIGTNACGPHALAYGRTADNVHSLDVVDGLGRRFTAGAGRNALDVVDGLSALVTRGLAPIRSELGRFGRQVSGYSLEHLLPENGRDLAKMLVGSEGTLVTMLGGTVRLVPVATRPVLVVLGYPDMIAAADAVPALLEHYPLAVEGLDARLVDVVRRAKGAGAVPELPAGQGWLMVEVGAEEHESEADVLARARALAAVGGTDAAVVVPAGAEADALWRIRADGAGLGGRTPAGMPAWPGWEDAAVPPENLGAYLRDFMGMLDRRGLDGLLYGHFGDGCVHVRVDFPLDDGERGAREFGETVAEAADIAVAHGGSLSGEHGDGRARSELLDRMYGPEVMSLFGQVKNLFDPRSSLNPGVLVDPDPVAAHLRRPAAKPLPVAPGGGFAFSEDGGDVTRAAHRCTGVGKCRADSSASGGFMCPSYLATKDEKDVTRGRARVLQEVTNGELVARWDDPALLDSLDLCLSCKACSADCPAGMDVARLKSETLHRAYRGKLRPRTHYTLGRLPVLAGLVTAVPGLARLTNAVLSVGALRRLAFAVAGVDTTRAMPGFATQRLSTWWRKRSGGRAAVRAAATAALAGGGHGDRGAGPGAPADVVGTGEETADIGAGASAGVSLPTDAPHGWPNRTLEADEPHARRTRGKDAPRYVVLFADTFSETLDGDGAKAVAELLETAGYTVVLPDQAVCCGLTWISTGQLDGARARMRNLLDVLAPFAANGIPVVGVEPSCTAALRDDMPELLPEDPRARMLADGTHTLAELLGSPAPLGPGDRWSAPDLTGVEVVAQPHCHHHSVMGWDTDRALLASTGASVTTLAGCCGLAGNFGMEKGHAEVSAAVAENALLPALRDHPGATFLADGFSCRTQADQLAGRGGVHLAELLLGRGVRG
ncbi:FAD-binding and (Fe-S)-binding domain-containing protein [Georgenia sp. Z1491]|uniref:FAD-binding and (Fe-S)-binding domain-containing protein n=1 Tax=Georgenia sp. Z1491 TaxID=3416707 RepID=UPI003CFA95CB